MTAVVIGIGNPDCGDDAAGRLVGRLLRGRLPHSIRIEETDGEATSLLARLEGKDWAYLIDACASGAAPGTLHRFDASRAPLPAARFGFSTHGMGLPDAIELARALGTLPPRCIVYDRALHPRRRQHGPRHQEPAGAAGRQPNEANAARLTEAAWRGLPWRSQTSFAPMGRRGGEPKLVISVSAS